MSHERPQPFAACIAFALITALVSPAGAQIVFKAPFVSYDYSPEFTAGAVGDLNGDGRADIVTNAGVILAKSNELLGPLDTAIGTSTTQALGDVNGDGRLDLATWSSSTLTSRLGDGAGHFATPHTMAFSQAQFMSIRDMNQDGKRDYVICQPNLISVILGTGNGGFGTQIDTPVSNYLLVTALVAEATGDGIPDVLLTDRDNKTISLYRGLGDGAFTAGVVLNVGDSPNSAPVVPVVTDLNGDGIPDIVTGYRSGGDPNGLSVYLGTGGGAFAARTNIHTTTTPRWLCAGDFDGDGHADVVVYFDATLTATLFHGGGDGTLTPGPDRPMGIDGLFIGVADVDGDGHLDIVKLLLGGNGKRAEVAYGTGTQVGGGQHLQTAPALYSNRGPVVGDFNGDHHPDLAFVAFSGNPSVNKVAVCPGQPDGTFGSPVAYSLPIALAGTGETPLAAGDFNGDGYADLVLAAWGNSDTQLNSTLIIWLGSAGGLLSPYVIPTGVGPASVVAADLDGDGLLDLVSVNEGGKFGPGTTPGNTIGVLLGHGDGTFGAPVPYAVGLRPVAAAVGDLNRDGIPDVVVANWSGNSISVLLGTGAGVLAARTDYLVPGSNPMPASIALGDFDRDGFLDVAVSGFFFRGNGNGTLVAAAAKGTGGIDIAAADVDVDGATDLVVVSQPLNGLEWFRGGAAFGDTLRPVYGTAQYPSSVTLAALGNDGRVTAIVTSSDGIDVLWGRKGAPTAVSPPLGVASHVRLQLAGSNPAAGPLRFDMVLAPGVPARFEVFDVGGRRVYSADAGGRAASLRVPAELALAPGVYHARLTQGREASEVRFVRLR